MRSNELMSGIFLNVSIVRAGLGSRVLAIARQRGIPGGTILLGNGSVNNPILRFLELAQSHKEIVLQASDCAHSRELLQSLHQQLRLDKPGQGICFSTRVDQLFGVPSTLGESAAQCGTDEKENPMHKLIVAIVDKGKAEQVVKASQDGGAQGATIVNARGSGVHETSRLFSMEIEPEKEMVLILAQEGQTEAICNAIRGQLGIDKPGKGVLFVQPINEVFGLIG